MTVDSECGLMTSLRHCATRVRPPVPAPTKAAEVDIQTARSNSVTKLKTAMEDIIHRVRHRDRNRNRVYQRSPGGPSRTRQCTIVSKPRTPHPSRV